MALFDGADLPKCFISHYYVRSVFMFHKNQCLITTRNSLSSTVFTKAKVVATRKEMDEKPCKLNAKLLKYGTFKKTHR